MNEEFVQVQSFDSIEDAFAAMRRGEAAANLMTTEEQRAVTWGDWFEVLREINMGLHAWGRIYGRDELADAERELGAPDAEIAHTMSMEDDAYSRGYRMARTFSVIEPEGELGHVHISKMRKITEEQFEKAREGGWK